MTCQHHDRGKSDLPDVVALTGGGSMRPGNSTNSRDVRAQVFNADGTALGGEIQVKTAWTSRAFLGWRLPDGRFGSLQQDQQRPLIPVPNAYAQLFEANGPVRQRLRQYHDGGCQNTPTLVALADLRPVAPGTTKASAPTIQRRCSARIDFRPPRWA